MNALILAPEHQILLQQFKSAEDNYQTEKEEMRMNKDPFNLTHIAARLHKAMLPTERIMMDSYILCRESGFNPYDHLGQRYS